MHPDQSEPSSFGTAGAGHGAVCDLSQCCRCQGPTRNWPHSGLYPDREPTQPWGRVGAVLSPRLDQRSVWSHGSALASCTLSFQPPARHGLWAESPLTRHGCCWLAAAAVGVLAGPAGLQRGREPVLVQSTGRLLRAAVLSPQKTAGDQCVLAQCTRFCNCQQSPPQPGVIAVPLT